MSGIKTVNISRELNLDEVLKSVIRPGRDNTAVMATLVPLDWVIGTYDPTPVKLSLWSRNEWPGFEASIVTCIEDRAISMEEKWCPPHWQLSEPEEVVLNTREHISSSPVGKYATFPRRRYARKRYYYRKEPYSLCCSPEFVMRLLALTEDVLLRQAYQNFLDQSQREVRRFRDEQGQKFRETFTGLQISKTELEVIL